MMTLALARQIAAAAFAEGRRRAIHNITIVVTDPSGAIHVALRADTQGGFGYATARAKARSALGFGCSTKKLAALFGDQPAATAGINAAVGGCFIPIAGAVLIVDAAGVVVGAASISGGNPDADDEIVRIAVSESGLASSD